MADKHGQMIRSHPGLLWTWTDRNNPAKWSGATEAKPLPDSNRTQYSFPFHLSATHTILSVRSFVRAFSCSSCRPRARVSHPSCTPPKPVQSLPIHQNIQAPFLRYHRLLTLAKRQVRITSLARWPSSARGMGLFLCGRHVCSRFCFLVLARPS